MNFRDSMQFPRPHASAIEDAHAARRRCVKETEIRRSLGTIPEIRRANSGTPDQLLLPGTHVGRQRVIRRDKKKAYEKALELKPDYAQAHASLGLLLWKSGNQTQGLEELQRAVMCDPDLGRCALQPRSCAGTIAAHTRGGSRIHNRHGQPRPSESSTREYSLGWLRLSQNNETDAAANIFRDLGCGATQKFAEGYNNLGLVLLQEAGRFQKDRKPHLSRPSGSSPPTQKRITISPWRSVRKVRKKKRSAKFAKAYELEPDLKSLPLP